MTREEFGQIHTWSKLYELMNNVAYGGMPGDLYEAPEEFMEGFINALVNNIHTLDDIQAMDTAQIDPNAEVWTATADFSGIVNYYDYEFSNIKRDFEDWLEADGYFDEENYCETDPTDMQQVPDNALDMLLFGT